MASRNKRKPGSPGSRKKANRRQDARGTRNNRESSRSTESSYGKSSRRFVMPQSSLQKKERRARGQESASRDRRSSASDERRKRRKSASKKSADRVSSKSKTDKKTSSQKNWNARRRADLKRSTERMSSQARKAMKARSAGATRFLIVLIIVAVVGLSGAGLYMSGAFPVKDVQVMGAEHLSQEDVAKIAAVPADSTMLRVNVSDITNRLEASPWVKSASVSRELPSTIKITITEREMAAVVIITSKETKQDEKWAIDENGVWLMKIPEEGAEGSENVPASVYADMGKVFLISDVPYGPEPAEGAKCTDKPVLNALKIVNGLSTDLANSITQISASDDHNTTLTLEDGVEIAFGDAEDIRTKERVCKQLMEEYPGQIVYINVRVVDRPTWRYY